MRNIILIFGLLSLFFQSCYAQHTEGKELQESYESFIDSLIVTDVKLSDKKLIKAIPKSQNEFSIFFNLDYKGEKEAKLFIRLNEEFENRCISNKEVLKFYLEMSKYVDGYYAESYFDFISYFVETNSEAFCNVFFDLSPANRVRIESFYQDNCRK